MLKHILGLIALVFLFTACTKDAELFTSDEVKTHRVAASDDAVDDGDDQGGVANTEGDTGDEGEEGGDINDDDDGEDDDDTDDNINDDDDEEDDDESNSVKDIQLN